MKNTLDDLITLLDIETLEKGLYRGQSQNLGFKALYGGQVLGQAVAAAQKTVETDQVIHSLHTYFILPGDASKPVIYQIDNVRDGRSFCTRRVKAIQNGREIFILMASFQFPGAGFDHQDTMPKTPPPHELSSYDEQLPDSVKQSHKPQITNAIDFRPATPYNWANPKPTPTNNTVWMKTIGDLPDDAKIHNSILAYTSDFGFLATALMQHGATVFNPNLQIATIDHSIWFHRPFRFDDWLLYDIHSPSACSDRALVKGQIYDSSGVLVASTTQEGVIRER